MSGVAKRQLEPRLIILGFVHVALALLAFSRATSTDESDIVRFTEIAAHGGTPWRAFEVEYAPGETVVILALPAADRATMARSVVVLALAADLAVATSLALGWGDRPARVYLLTTLPLLTFLFYRLDLVVVAAVVLGVLALRRHPRTGGAVLGIAVLMKVWPIVLLPVLARQRKHAAVSTVMVVGAGSAIWMVWGGIDAIRQVAGFRGATGWSLGSTVGSIVWVLTGGPVTLEAGSPRTGVASLPWRVALLVALIAVCLLAYRWARAWRGDPFGLPSLTVLGALLIASPLFSLQYACWLAPSIAIAWDEDDRPTATPGAIAVALTGATFALVQVSGGGVATRLTLLARNASVVWMTFVGLRAMARGSSSPT